MGRVEREGRHTGEAAAPTRVHQRVVAFTLSLIALAYLDRVCISTAAPAIRHDLGLSGLQMGLVFSAFTFAYALFEVPSGWFADRFGPRLTITRIVVWWSVMTALTGVAVGFVSLVLLRLLFGIGEAGVFPATARVYARWLPPSQTGRTFGAAIMAGVLAGALTLPLVASMLEVMDWRHTFPIFGAMGLVWAGVWWTWFRDDPADHRGVNAAELDIIRQEDSKPAEGGSRGGGTVGPTAPRTRVAVSHGAVPWQKLARSRTLFFLCAMYGGVIYGWYFYLTWLPTYLLEARGFALQQAGWLSALPLVGIATGVFAGGWASDFLCQKVGVRVGRRVLGLIGLPLGAWAVVAGVLTANAPMSAVYLAMAAGFAALGVAPAWAVCLEIGGRHAGVVTGAMNTFGNIGGALSPIVVGFCVQRLGSWHAPLFSVAALYLFAAVCWLGIDAESRIDA